MDPLSQHEIKFGIATHDSITCVLQSHQRAVGLEPNKFLRNPLKISQKVCILESVALLHMNGQL